jgi:apolipoprotein D and lipocalin family protein
VIGLADDYSRALVGEPSGRYLWILAREPRLSPELKADLIARLKAQGYNTDVLALDASSIRRILAAPRQTKLT